MVFSARVCPTNTGVPTRFVTRKNAGSNTFPRNRASDVCFAQPLSNLESCHATNMPLNDPQYKLPCCPTQFPRRWEEQRVLCLVPRRVGIMTALTGWLPNYQYVAPRATDVPCLFMGIEKTCTWRETDNGHKKHISIGLT